MSALALTLAAAAPAPQAVLGLDHIPVAVNDLERARSDFEALGFTLKPGRLHDNGLRNLHLKFRDGTEIELITAVAAKDPLSSLYRAWLKSGDGPAYLALFAPDFGILEKGLSRLGLALDVRGEVATISRSAALERLFFAHRQRSATDRPEHFAHANSAISLAAVWLAGATAEQRLLAELGLAPIDELPCGPLGAGSAVLAFAEGEIVFLPATAQLEPGRSLVAATVRVMSLESARTILTDNRIPFLRVSGCARDSLWVGPAHGLWLEFRER